MGDSNWDTTYTDGSGYTPVLHPPLDLDAYLSIASPTLYPTEGAFAPAHQATLPQASPNPYVSSGTTAEGGTWELDDDGYSWRYQEWDSGGALIKDEHGYHHIASPWTYTTDTATVAQPATAPLPDMDGARADNVASPGPSDLDGDGVPDYLDKDIDGDGKPNVRDSDADGNGIRDWEDQRRLRQLRDGARKLFSEFWTGMSAPDRQAFLQLSAEEQYETFNDFLKQKFDELAQSLGVESPDPDEGEEGGEDIQFVAASTTPQWHHLLPQKFKEKFWTLLGIDIDEPAWGVLMDPKDHDAIHPRWENEWDDWFEDFKENGKVPTRDDFFEQYTAMVEDDEFKAKPKMGRKPAHSYKQWKNLKPEAKVGAFKRAARAMAILGAALGVVAAADDAQAAFGPLLVLQDDAARKEYQDAIRALQQNRVFQAHKALFGSGDSADIFEKNPKGLITRMLSRMYHANQLTQNPLLELYDEAKEKFQEMARNRI